MIKTILQFATAAALTCASSLCATGGQQLTISDNAGDSFTIDQTGAIVSTAGSVSIAAGNINVDGLGSISVDSTISTVMVGPFKINSVTCFGLADSIAPQLQDEITLDTSSTGAGTLNILYTDTTYSNLTTALALHGSESTSNTPATQVTFTAFGSNGVAIPATTPFLAIGPLAGTSASGNVTVVNPFTGPSASLSSLSSITFSGAGSFNTTFNISSSGSTPPSVITHGDTATIGFWHNKNGQAVIDSFNTGSAATGLGNWLASNFPSLFGTANPYTGTSLAGLTNAQVATVYENLWNPSGVTKNTYVQVFATALACYATSTSLAGNDPTVTMAGFIVSSAGTCADTFNVGSNGAAAGVPNGTSLTVLQLLQLANTNFNPTTGVFYGGDQVLTSDLNNIFNGINSAGDI